MYPRYLLVTLLLLSPFANAINILSINAEPTRGVKAVPGITAAVTEKSQPLNATPYIALIKNSKADVVGITELNGMELAVNIIKELGDNWQLHTREDRNSTTNIRVALLSRLNVVKGSISNLSDLYGYSRHEKHRSKPAATLAAGFELDGQNFYAVITYLTAGEGEYAQVRYAQADAVRTALFSECKENYQHCIVMGNMNDEPGSEVIKRLQGMDGMFGDKIAMHQAEINSGSVGASTYGEGVSATRGDQIMTTLYGTGSFLEVDSNPNKHKSLLLVSREPYKAEKPDGKTKRNSQKLAAFYKLQHLQELVEKQRTYIDVLELERNTLQQQLNSPPQQPLQAAH